MQARISNGIEQWVSNVPFPPISQWLEGQGVDGREAHSNVEWWAELNGI